MEVNELRIGNYVRYDNSFIKVTTIAVDFNNNPIIIAHTDSWTWSSNQMHIQPIELTEEIFIKCGFEYDKFLIIHSKLGGIYLSEPFREADYFLIKSNSGDKISSIKYLHQLQNLFFILTGEELQINL